MDVASGSPIPVFGVAYRMAELLRTLHEVRPERRYSLSAPRDRRVGNIDVRVMEYGKEIIVGLPTRLTNGTWILTPWQYLLLEIEKATSSS